jgi:hypothetical protein
MGYVIDVASEISGGIPIQNEITLPAHRPAFRIGQIAPGLQHPRFIRSPRDSYDVYNPIGKTDHEQQIVGYAISRRCQRSSVSGEPIVSRSSRALRPTALAFLASSARSASVNRMCFPRSRSLSSRFSA